jgi:hypothetical protein
MYGYSVQVLQHVLGQRASTAASTAACTGAVLQGPYIDKCGPHGLASSLRCWPRQLLVEGAANVALAWARIEEPARTTGSHVLDTGERDDGCL